MKTNTIKIQSIGDLITNSSTEVFTIVDEDTVSSLKDIVSTIAGEEILDRFDFFLDYCDNIEDRIEEILESLEDDEISVGVTIDDNYEEQKKVALRIIASVMDPEVVAIHYHLVDETTNEVKPLRYKTWENDHYVEKEEIVPFEQDIADRLKDNVFRYLDDINDNREWKSYPSIVVVPKDKTSEKDKKIAKAIERIPFMASHEASYC